MPDADTDTTTVMDAPANDAPAKPEPFTREFHPLTTPLGDQIPEGLKALMRREMPVDEDNETSDEPAPEPTDEPPVEKPAKPVSKSSKKSVIGDLLLPPDIGKKPDAPPAVEDIQPFPEEIVSTAKTPKAKADIEKFRKAYEAMGLEVKQLREKSKTLPAVDDTAAEALKAELEQVRKQHADMSAQLEREALYRHPKFHQQFVGPRDKMMADAVEIVKESGGDGDALERALAIPNKAARVAALDEIAGSIESTILRDRLGRLLDGVDEKNRAIEGVLKNSKQNLTRLQQEQKIAEHQSLVENEKQMTALMAATRSDLAEKMGLEVLHKTDQEGFEWWNKQVDDIDETAKHITFKLQPQEVPTVAYLAASAGAFRQWAQNEQKARIALQERLDAIENAEPGLNGKHPSKPAPEGEFGPDEDITKVALTRLRRGDF